MKKHRWETVDIKLLTKEELVIEYVSARFWLGSYAERISGLSVEDGTGPYDDCRRLRPGKKWGYRICRHMWKHRDVNDPYVDGSYMAEFGVDVVCGERIFAEMCEKGRMDWPIHDGRGLYHAYLTGDAMDDERDGPGLSAMDGDWDELMKVPRDMIELDFELVRSMYRELRDKIADIAESCDEYRWLDTPLTEYIGKVRLSDLEDRHGHIRQREIHDQEMRGWMREYEK